MSEQLKSPYFQKKSEKMLKDLVAKTEAVIRGERKDVI